MMRIVQDDLHEVYFSACVQASGLAGERDSVKEPYLNLSVQMFCTCSLYISNVLMPAINETRSQPTG